jgi:hypothetical protein
MKTTITTREDYINAWTTHVRDLRWMYLETNTHLETDAKMAQLEKDIEAAADDLVKRGKLKGDHLLGERNAPERTQNIRTQVRLHGTRSRIA